MTKGDGGFRIDGRSSDLREAFLCRTVGGSVSGIWSTAFVVCFLLFFHLLRSLLGSRNRKPNKKYSSSTVIGNSSSSASTRTPNCILSDVDLKDLIDELHGNRPSESHWEDVVDKSNDLLSYSAKCCRQKDGSLKYLSITKFDECSTDLLRDFYMDNEYRKKWDKTIVDHEQLEVDRINMIEVGRTVKKFPFLTPREYVLMWCLWEGNDKTFYCIIKDCEHPRAPLQKKYVRVGFFRSGWRIRKVPARDACEITMIHQEDAGLNVEMARLAFAKGIWSYICKMNGALREYSTWIQRTSIPTNTPCCKKVPIDLECEQESIPVMTSSENSKLMWQEESTGNPSKTWMTRGLLLLGGVICLSKGHSSLATQVVVAVFLKKFASHGQVSEESQEPNLKDSPRAPAEGGRWSLNQQNWSKKSNHTGFFSTRLSGGDTRH